MWSGPYGREEQNRRKIKIAVLGTTIAVGIFAIPFLLASYEEYKWEANIAEKYPYDGHSTPERRDYFKALEGAMKECEYIKTKKNPLESEGKSHISVGSEFTITTGNDYVMKRIGNVTYINAGVVKILSEEEFNEKVAEAAAVRKLIKEDFYARYKECMDPHMRGFEYGKIPPKREKESEE